MPRERQLVSLAEIRNALTEAAREDGLVGETDSDTEYPDRLVGFLVQDARAHAIRQAGSRVWNTGAHNGQRVIYDRRHVNLILRVISELPDREGNVTAEVLRALKASPATIEKARRTLHFPKTKKK